MSVFLLNFYSNLFFLIFLQWLSEGQTEASVYQQAENGKTELSLMHFTIKNPHWQPPQESSVFISHLKEKVQHDAQSGPSTQLLLSEAPLCTSLQSNESATGVRNLEDHASHTVTMNQTFPLNICCIIWNSLSEIVGGFI